jgi:hypothetical protein
MKMVTLMLWQWTWFWASAIHLPFSHTNALRSIWMFSCYLLGLQSVHFPRSFFTSILNAFIILPRLNMSSPQQLNQKQSCPLQYMAASTKQDKLCVQQKLLMDKSSLDCQIFCSHLVTNNSSIWSLLFIINTHLLKREITPFNCFKGV